jgi:hypothetical protein
VADGADTLADLLALCAEALVLVASGCHVLCNLLQARCRLWGTTWTTLYRCAVSMVEVLLQPGQSLFGLCNGLVGSSLFGGQWRRNGLTEFMLHMEQVRRVMCPKVMFNIRE